jgi:methionyl-tRNA formyltransferase
MTPSTLSAAFFGSFPISYNLAGGAVKFLHAYCDHNFVDMEIFNRIRDPASVELRRFYSPNEMVDLVSSWSGVDVLVVAGFAYRLPMDVIRRFKWVINMHPGDLHTNRGATPMANEILHQNPFFSASLHVIDSERLNSGPFISSARFAARYDQDYLTNKARLDNLGGLLLVESLCRLSNGFDIGASHWIPLPGSYRPQVPADTMKQMVKARSLNDFLAANQDLLLQPA